MRDESGRPRLPAATRTAGRPQPRPAARSTEITAQDAADVAFAATGMVVAGARTVFKLATRTSHEVLRLMPLPGAVRRRAQVIVQVAREQGEAQRTIAVSELRKAADVIVPRAVEEVLVRTDVAGVVDQLDVDAIVDRLDLDAIVARVDLDRVIERVDLIGLARYVVDGIDLPAIIRSSSGSVTTEVVRGIRRGSADADQTVERIVDRMLLRRAPRRPASPTRPVATRGDDRAT